jgi:DNA polymerase III delta prime subunit
MLNHTLWVELYRPQTLESYIGNDELKAKIKIYLESGDIPHLLLVGPAGTGKTTLAKLLAKNMDCDALYINASTRVGTLEDRETRISDYCSTVGFSQFKMVILDEADYLTPTSQASLRSLMETFSRYTRFILTANYVERIIDPIQSRCQVFKIIPPSKKDVAIRLASILDQENVEYTVEDIGTIVTSGYPDIRRVINSAQRQTVNKVLKVDKFAMIQNDYRLKILEHLKNDSKQQRFNNIRQLLADTQVNNFTELYKLLYDTIDDWGKGHIAPCVLIIAEAQATDAFCVDKEIHVCALMIRILSEIKTK